MTTPTTSNWSESLQQQTRQAIEDIPVTPEGRLHFKHAGQGYAYAKLDDLCQDRLILHARDGGDAHHFEDVQSLLDAGWALD